jgi:uncharacterized protein (TIGR02391 family)
MLVDIEEIIRKLEEFKSVLIANDSSFTTTKYAEIRAVTEVHVRKFFPEDQLLSNYLNNAANFPDSINWGNSRIALLMALNSLIENLKTKTIHSSFNFSALHPIVKTISAELFRNGHYRQAILDTYIALVQQVKAKSNSDLDNSKLMQKVFSSEKPIIKVSEDADERVGFMWLFTGAVMGIRNPRAHNLTEEEDPQRAFELLAFASALFRVIDDSQVSS